MLKWSAATASRDALETFAQGEAAGRKRGHAEDATCAHDHGFAWIGIFLHGRRRADTQRETYAIF